MHIRVQHPEGERDAALWLRTWTFKALRDDYREEDDALPDQ